VTFASTILFPTFRNFHQPFELSSTFRDTLFDLLRHCSAFRDPITHLPRPCPILASTLLEFIYLRSASLAFPFARFRKFLSRPSPTFHELRRFSSMFPTLTRPFHYRDILDVRHSGGDLFEKVQRVTQKVSFNRRLRGKLRVMKIKVQVALDISDVTSHITRFLFF
jgi:hypothetical protein